MASWYGPQAPRPAVRPSLQVEALEDRLVPAAHAFSLVGLPHHAPAQTTIYTETNNPTAGANAVLAFHPTANGGLGFFHSYGTGGTGQLNIPKAVGPDDGDGQVVLTPDRKFLFAVNQGSHSITSFRVGSDGALTKVGTFESNGTEPDGLAIVGDRLYVANRGDASSAHAGTVKPNVTGFDIGDDGSLTAIEGSTVDFAVGTFATQIVAPKGRNLLFVQVASLAGATDGNTVEPFRINEDGTLTAAPGGAVGAGTAPKVQLGLALHPTRNIIYSGLAANGQVGVYTYDETGRLGFVGSAADQGKAPCWCVVSPDGQFLYVGNTLTDTVGVYSLIDPLKPIQVQDFHLGGPGSSGAKPTSLVFELAFDSNGKTLYAVSQAATPEAAAGNLLHRLTVHRNGSLSEDHRPFGLTAVGTPTNAHPQGVAVLDQAFARRHHEGDWNEERWHVTDWQDEQARASIGQVHTHHGW